MNSEEQFKDSLKKVLGSKEFSFEESSWEQAMQMRSEENKKNRIVPFLIAALILVTGGVISYFYFTTGRAGAIAQHAPPTENNTVNGTEAAARATEEKITYSNKTLPAISSNQPGTGLTNLPAEPAVPVKTAGPDLIAAKAPAAATAGKEEEKNNSSVAAAGPEKTQGRQVTALLTTAPLTAPAVKNTGSETAATTPANETKTVPAEDAGKPIAATGKQDENEPASTPIDNTAKTTGEVLETAAELPAPATTGTNDPAQPNGINSQVAETAAAPTDTSGKAVAKADSTAGQNAAGPGAPETDRRIIMCFEAGASFLTGWNNPGKKDAQGFNPVVGFNYYNYLGPQLAVSLGAQYTTVSSLGYTNHISRVTRYNLGEESDVTAITPQKAHYLAVPVRVHYALNARNTFGAGVNVAYLLTVDSKMEKYHERLNTRSNYQVSHTQGYTEGFKAFDTQLSVFYRRKIYRNLSVHTEFVYGLTDIKDNTFFNSKVFERNTGIKLTLMYNLFK